MHAARQLVTAIRNGGRQSSISKRLSTADKADSGDQVRTAASLLVEAGPPNEWSGGVAGVLGKEGRKRLQALWRALSRADQKKVYDAFEAMFMATDVILDIEEGYGELAKNAAPLELMTLPPIGYDPIPATVQYRFAEGRLHTDILFKVGKSVVGWTVAGQRPEAVPEKLTVGTAKRIAAGFSINGDRYHRPFVDPCGLPVVPLVKCPTAELVVAVDRPNVEFGMMSDSHHEYFLSKGNRVSGILNVRRLGSGHWIASVSKDLLPSVLSSYAVLSGRMPDDGYSALPKSLEQIIPDRFHYWKMGGSEARNARDGLVEADIVRALDLRLVDGEIRMTTEKRFLCEKGDLPRSTTLASVIASIIPKGREYVHPFLSDDWSSALSKAVSDEEALIVMSPSNELDNSSLETIARKLATAKADWLVDFDDNPESRRILSSIGRPFKVRGEAFKLFCASFPISSSRIDWIDVGKARSARPQEARTEKSQPWDRDIKIFKAAEERFVLGVVLEPNDGSDGAPLDPDAQNDIYSAAEIRQAAHTFMEKFGHIGLMHREFIDGSAKILESYIALSDQVINGVKVREGTWLLGIRVLSDKLWKDIKDGVFNAFSIGGSAIRRAKA